jgi:hypothetical protein
MKPVNVYLLERKKLDQSEESKEKTNANMESSGEKSNDQKEDKTIADTNPDKQISCQTNLILLNPVPSAKDYSFAMDKNEGLFQMYGLTELNTNNE